MPRYFPALTEPPDDPLDYWREQYDESDRIEADALAWVSVAPEVPAELVDDIVAWYRTTAQYSCTVEDFMDGEDQL